MSRLLLAGLYRTISSSMASKLRMYIGFVSSIAFITSNIAATLGLHVCSIAFGTSNCAAIIRNIGSDIVFATSNYHCYIIGSVSIPYIANCSRWKSFVILWIDR